MSKIIEVAPDGKQEQIEGQEPLKKDPRKKKAKSLADRWALIKAALDNTTAIMDIKEEGGFNEPPPGQEQPQEGELQDTGAALPEESAQPEEGEEEIPPESADESSPEMDPTQPEGEEEEVPEDDESSEEEPVQESNDGDSGNDDELKAALE